MVEEEKNGQAVCYLRKKTLAGPSAIKARTYEEEEPLLYHSNPIPGKYTIKTTKAMNN